MVQAEMVAEQNQTINGIERRITVPREKEAYRDNVERIKLMYPDKELLSRKEVCTFCKIDYRTASKMFTFKNNYISVATLARELS